MKSVHEILAAIFSAKEKPKKDDCPCGCKGTCGCLASQAEARTIIRRIRFMRKVRTKGSRRTRR